MGENKAEIIICKDKNEASSKALEVLLQTVDLNTLLLLSGGSSPDVLYQIIAQGKTLRIGAVALIDERFGAYMHTRSNEKMIAETGLLSYLDNEDILFYGVLKEDNDMENTARKYEQIIKGLFKKFSKRVAIMGIGSDGHTAGIKPALEYDHTRLVVSYDDVSGSFGKRITLTFEALSKIDEFVILAFGESKRKALEQMFKSGSQQELPAVFFTKTSAKVLLLTDIVTNYS